MESSDQYNFSIFAPRNLHGRKNRNVIFTMLLIWAVAVFGFQILLRVIEKPTPEKALGMFESAWPSVLINNTAADYKTFLTSLVLVKGKNIVTPQDQSILNEAISSVTFRIIPENEKNQIIGILSELQTLKNDLNTAKDEKYLALKISITDKKNLISVLIEPYSGFITGGLEANILTSSLQLKYPESLNDSVFSGLPEIMKLYLTHNQSKLTDTKFLGFPFHYFYTAVFLLIMFIILCIVYNKLIEWRLEKQGIVE
jgi:uncharacterized membrane protein